MKTVERWRSDIIDDWITLARWGTSGTPVILFPTAGGDAEEAERFQLIDALGGLLADGRIKVYSIDSVSGRSWLRGDDPRHAMWLQNAFDRCIADEVVPAIRTDCQSSDIELVSAGASIGAFWALQVLTRHPDIFKAAVCMSGTYDLSDRLDGHWSDDFFYSSPLHFVPGLEGPQLDMLRNRLVILAFGSGRWEDPSESWRVAEMLGAKGVPNRADDWGPHHDHDWPTWREMLPQYLSQLA